MMQYEDERGAVYYIAYIGRSRWGIYRDTEEESGQMCEYPFFSGLAAQLELDEKAKRYGWREAKPAV
ncbi:hypothetical protein HMPREF1147_1310 [Selenomonas sp. FOBRC9]|uniref:hypothetical protein n=1 Tax=Selenomonas sp. FOBRC9 TaxID=936573 RepID=UPI00027A6043|nr:hypothetical protein [Selenomonas sp. FOBRC9]EJP32307.1 hypothetical protein HMPREF1147_1310 [Selenomonas sp. FOBRC9]